MQQDRKGQDRLHTMPAVVNRVKFKPIKHAMLVQPHDGWVAIITFVLTLVLAPHVEYAIMVGVLLSSGLYLSRTMRPRFAELALDEDGTLHDAKVFGLPTCDYVSVLRFDGSLYFASSGYFEQKVLANVAAKPDLRVVIVDAEGINQIDATGEEMISGLMQRLSASGVQLYVARAKKQVLDIFRKTGILSRLGDDHFYRTCADAIQAAAELLTAEQVATSPICRPNVKLRVTHKPAGAAAPT